MSSGNHVLEQFRNPSTQYRGMPFWAWNGSLEKEELTRQIRIMKEMGLGGFFMHTRVGLKTPYMGDEFMDCVKACIEEAERLGMKAYLYDEDRWPSGAAGGIVTKDEKYRARFLYYREIPLDGSEVETYSSTDPLLAIFLLRYKGGKLLSYERLKEIPQNVSSDCVLYGFYRGITESNSWFNDQTYLDALNPEAVKRFLDVTHEKYYKYFASSFGNTVPGIFSDEPTFKTFIQPADSTSWTDALPEKFIKTYSYDILDHLPELFFDCGKMVSQVRYHFCNLRTKLFTDSFACQIGQWCEDHKIALTGHVLAEDSLRSQTHHVGAAMRSYEYMQMPGTDLLTEHWQTLNTAKQCVSAARQCARRFRLSETYGCTGWDFPFMGHKALGDWQYALGINFRCQHLAWYTMEAEAKRDYPSSISFQASWHKSYPVVEDYFARLSALLSQGEEIRDLLVIHPIESYFSAAYPGNDKALLYEYNQNFAKLTTRLLVRNIDFDFGDEEMMSRLATVENTTLKVGHASYKIVLIPPLYTIRRSTLELLRSFVVNGGTVAYMGKIPQYVDALPSEDPLEVYKAFSEVRENMFEDKLFVKVPRRISITTVSGEQTRTTLSHLSSIDGKDHTLFICNTGCEFDPFWEESPFVRERNTAYNDTKIAVTLPPGGKVYELDPQTGNAYCVPFTWDQGAYHFQTSFAPLQSRLYWIGQEIPDALPPAKKLSYAVKASSLPGKAHTVTLTGANTLVLDHGDLFIDGVKHRENTFFFAIDDYLRAALGKSPRGGMMVQPYLQDKTIPAKTLDIELVYSFFCDTLPEGVCDLALERPDLYDITLNGQAVNNTPVSWWVDPSIATVHIPSGYLRKGKNILTLKGIYHEKLPGLESLFILGDFSVFDGKINTPVKTLDFGDWAQQGLENYTQDVIYHTSFATPPHSQTQQVYLKVPRWRGVSMGISVNGSEELPLPYPPFELDITKYLTKDSNTLDIRIYGSCRNAFGPFYTGQKWQAWTGPDQFKAYISSSRQLVPGGILAPPEIWVKE